jgi:PAS domain S-box-containing protein
VVLSDDAKRVLAKLTPMDAEVVSDQSRWYLRHIAPYRTSDDRIGGVVVSFTDITERKHAEQQVHDAKEFAESIVDTMREPLLVLNPDLTVQRANGTFYRRFQVSREDTEGQPIFELGNRQWDIPELRQLLEDVLPANNLFNDFEVEHDFEGIGRRTMLLNGRRLDSVQLILLAIEDDTERKRAEAAVRASEQRLRKVLETDAVGVLFFDPSGTLVDANDIFLRAMGYSRTEVESRELTWRLMTPAEWVEVSLEQWNKLQATGHIGPYEKEYLRKDGSRSWMLFAGARLDEDAIVEFCIDINDRKRAEAERELLAHELSHRVKNIIAVVQALAMQTDVRVGSVEAYREAFLGRLHAMADAHSLLLETDFRHTDLKMLVEKTVGAYHVDHPEAFEVGGDPVTLTAKQGIGLSLVLHELGTNAAKYGALSRHEGRLRISWQVENNDQGRRVRLEWRERHGPQVAPPTKIGFGTKLIKQACVYDLDGEVELEYAPEGLTYTIVFPLE